YARRDRLLADREMHGALDQALARALLGAFLEGADARHGAIEPQQAPLQAGDMRVVPPPLPRCSGGHERPTWCCTRMRSTPAKHKRVPTMAIATRFTSLLGVARSP